MAGWGGVDVWSALSDQRFQVVRMSFGVAGAVGPSGRPESGDASPQSKGGQWPEVAGWMCAVAEP